MALSQGDKNVADALHRQNKFAKSIAANFTDWDVTAGKVGNILGEIATTFPTYGRTVAAKAATKSELLKMGAAPEFYKHMPMLKRLQDVKVLNTTLDYMSRMPVERFVINNNMKPIAKFFNRAASMSEEGFKMWAVNEMIKNNPHTDINDVIAAGLTGSLFNIWSLGVGTALQKFAGSKLGISGAYKSYQGINVAIYG